MNNSTHVNAACSQLCVSMRIHHDGSVCILLLSVIVSLKCRVTCYRIQCMLFFLHIHMSHAQTKNSTGVKLGLRLLCNCCFLPPVCREMAALTTALCQRSTFVWMYFLLLALSCVHMYVCTSKILRTH